MKRFKNQLAYAGAVLIAVSLTWLIHELTHWITARALGYSPVMTLNTVSVGRSGYHTDWHQLLVSAMGPVITVLQALLIHWILMTRGWKRWLYPYLLLAFYMRLLAGIVNLINLNDEGRISHFLGIGDFTLSIIVSAFLFLLVYKVSVKHKSGWRYQLFTLMLIMLFSSILILADNAWHPVLLG